MNTSYILDNYRFSGFELARSVLVSAYGTRHLSHAKDASNWNERIVHSLIGLIESMPVIGQVASVFERIFVYMLLSKIPEVQIHPKSFHWPVQTIFFKMLGPLNLKNLLKEWSN